MRFSFPKQTALISVAMLLPSLLLVSGCNRHLEVISDAPAPEDIPPTDTEKMAFFYQISPDQADNLLKNNRELYVFDFRSPEAHAAGHLPRANHLAWPNEQITEILAPLDRKTPVLAYADMTPELFHGVLRIRTEGFLNVYWLSLGFASWVDAGKPVYDAEEKQVPKEKAEALAAAEKGTPVVSP